MSKEIEILMSTGMTKHDAEKHLKEGASIYEVDDFMKNFDEYTREMDDEYKEELRAFLTSGKDGHLWDNDVTTYNGIRYYIEYVL